MRYHFVINGYSTNVMEQMEEMNGFKQAHLTNIEEGESILYCGNQEQVMKVDGTLSEKVVLLIGLEHYIPEVILKLLEEEMDEEDVYIFGSDYSGIELCVRIAARKKGSSVTAAYNLDTQSRVSVKKMVYSNHMEGSFWMKKGPYCISLARNLEKVKLEKGKPEISHMHITKESNTFVETEKREQEQQKDGLEEASLVVVGGRGVRGADGVKQLEQIAQKLGGCVGVSRPVAMNAWASMDKLVGVSGAMIHPDICIVAGVSGAAALYAGIEKSKCIVAVNSDKAAPIMKKADVVIIEDYHAILESLLYVIQREEGR